MAEDEEKKDEDVKNEKPPEAKPITLPPSKETESGPPPEQPPPPGYGPGPAYGPPPEPFFRANNLQKILAIGLLLGIIVLLIGAMLTASADFIKIDAKDPEDDLDLQRNLDASGHLLGGIGLFLTALFVLLPLLLIHDLSEKQQKLLMLLMMAIIIGFAFLAAI